ncbi:MAG: M24 family metallopeptidase [Candidatus Heimdallarchaeota archaeon]
MKLAISKERFQMRIQAVRERLQEKKLDGMVIFSPKSIFYLCGFGHIATERPIAMFVPVAGEPSLFIPMLEVDNVRIKVPWITDVGTYYEYPQGSALLSGEFKHPMKLLAKFLQDKGFASKALGADRAGAAATWGYIGPKLKEVLPEAKITLLKDLIMQLRIIKDPEEIALIRESAKWGNLAHTFLQEFTEPGESEIEITVRASYEATRAMLRTLGPDFEMMEWGLPASAGFRGQVGAGSALPHALGKNIKIRKGDVLVTGAGARIGGYNSELERTMIVGEPSEKQKKYFEIMVKAQDAALETFKPGIKCSEVDKAANRVFKEAGCFKFMRHHTGHGLGTEGHEPPFLDIGSDVIIRPGMVFSCEPGIYIPEFAGFRHSDTVLITEDGAERITYYPRDLESMTIL